MVILKLFWPQGLPKFKFTKLDMRGAAAVAHKRMQNGEDISALVSGAHMERPLDLRKAVAASGPLKHRMAALIARTCMKI